MINYNNGKIYKICSKTMEGDIYIGSTTKKNLSKRMSGHVYVYKKVKSGISINKTKSFDIFDKYGVENCCIILLENVNAKDKNELKAREAYYIKTLECINKQIPLRSKQEYRDDNKDKAYKYYYDNKINILDKMKKKIICDCGSEICKSTQKRHEKSKKHQKYINKIK